MVKKYLCTSCRSIGKVKIITKGSIFIEFFLWCCFILPGLLYSLWRLTARNKYCRCCDSENVIPEDSPRAKMIIEEMNQK